MSSDPAEWVDLYADYLFAIAFFGTNDRELAEDLVQDTFLSGIRALNSFESRSSEKTWLTSILNNKIIDHYRKKSRLLTDAEYLLETDQSFYSSFFRHDEVSSAHWKKTEFPAEWSMAADEKLNDKEFQLIFQQCLSRMPERLIPVFTMKYIDGKKSEFICKELNISTSNYWVIIHRAKILLRKCLELNWFSK